MIPNRFSCIVSNKITQQRESHGRAEHRQQVQADIMTQTHMLMACYPTITITFYVLPRLRTSGNARVNNVRLLHL